MQPRSEKTQHRNEVFVPHLYGVIAGAGHLSQGFQVVIEVKPPIQESIKDASSRTIAADPNQRTTALPDARPDVV
jgi:hypothetical protein